MFQLVIDWRRARSGNGLACILRAQGKATVRECAMSVGFAVNGVWQGLPPIDPTTAE